MEDSAEPVLSAYLEIDDLLWIGEWVGDGAQRGCLVQGLMGAVLIVETFLFA